MIGVLAGIGERPKLNPGMVLSCRTWFFCKRSGKDPLLNFWKVFQYPRVQNWNIEHQISTWTLKLLSKSNRSHAWKTLKPIQIWSGLADVWEEKTLVYFFFIVFCLTVGKIIKGKIKKQEDFCIREFLSTLFLGELV